MTIGVNYTLQLTTTLQMGKYILMALVAMLSFSCATTYRAVDPQKSNYYTEMEIDSIKYGFDKETFQLQAKKRYAKKARKKDVSIVGFYVENNTADTLLPIRDLTFQHGGKNIKPMPLKEAHVAVSQGEILHFLWYAIAIPIPAVVDAIGSPFIQAPVALITGNYNMFMAGAANRKFRENLQRDNIVYRKIPPGESMYGLVSFNQTIISDLTIQRAKKRN